MQIPVLLLVRGLSLSGRALPKAIIYVKSSLNSSDALEKKAMLVL